MTLPALFIGHGSPMLAITPNPFMPQWRARVQPLPKPRAVLCVSAHWVSTEIALTASESPDLIYDFYGFPPALYRQTYPAAGAPWLAQEVQQCVQNALPGAVLQHDMQRGWDHGTWTVMQQLYPDADVPVVQMSLSSRLTFAQHITLAQALRPLRSGGILLVGSGNLIHNLRLLDRQRMDDIGYGFDWAKRAQAILIKHIINNDLDALSRYPDLGEDVALAVNSGEHFLPLLYVLAQREHGEAVQIFNQECVGGALDMTCVQVG